MQCSKTPGEKKFALRAAFEGCMEPPLVAGVPQSFTREKQTNEIPPLLSELCMIPNQWIGWTNGHLHR